MSTRHRKPPPKTQAKPSLHLTWEDWLPYLEDSTATDAEKRQLIETLWSIMLAFADLGWELDAPEKTSGQSLDLNAALQAAVLNSSAKELEKQKEEV